jgi:large subunit ribosomal protein L20
MARIKSSVPSRRRRKKVLQQARGYYGAKSRLYRIAKQQLLKSLSYAYRDRMARKREFRKLWIIRINAAARNNGLSYNKFISGLKIANINIDRKILSDIAVIDPQAFSELANVAKQNVKVAVS